jgi:hypothetical protein
MFQREDLTALAVEGDLRATMLSRDASTHLGKDGSAD